MRPVGRWEGGELSVSTTSWHEVNGLRWLRRRSSNGGQGMNTSERDEGKFRKITVSTGSPHDGRDEVDYRFKFRLIFG
jgi:hypothetical protein